MVPLRMRQPGKAVALRVTYGCPAGPRGAAPDARDAQRLELDEVAVDARIRLGEVVPPVAELGVKLEDVLAVAPDVRVVVRLARIPVRVAPRLPGHPAPTAVRLAIVGR